jgi:hypothetical protein
MAADESPGTANHDQIVLHSLPPIQAIPGCRS